MLRKWISLLLITTLLCTTYIPAFAGDYRLPKSLKVIGEEAFADDIAENIYIPEGTESIEARAFTGMAFSELHIPDSVEYIAEDAIDYGMTIVCSMESYAKFFIDNHPGRYAWKEANPLDKEKAVDEMKNLDPDDFDDDTSPIEALEHLSTEGIDDPEQLADVEEYNQLVDQFNENIGYYNINEQDLLNQLQTGYDFSEFDIDQSGGEFRCSFGGLTASMDESFMSAMDIGAEVTEVVNSNDGITTIKLSNGSTYYLSGTDTSFQLSSQQPVVSKAAQYISKAGSENTALEKFKNAVSKLHDLAYSVEVKIRGGINDLNTQIGRASGYIDKLERKIEKLKTWRQNTMNPENMHRVFEAKREKLKARRAKWIMGLKIWSGLGMLESIHALTEIIGKWTNLLKVSECGHPNDDDREPAKAYEMAVQLRRDINTLCAMYATDGMMCIAEIVSTIVLFCTAIPTGGTSAVGGKIALALVKGVMGMLFHDYETKLYKSVNDTHPLLHTYLCGTVVDVETQESLDGVTIDLEGYLYFTDENGFYKTRILDANTHTFRVIQQGYQEYSFEDRGRIGDTWTRGNTTLNKLKGTVYGHVYNSKTGEPVENPRVYSNEIIRLFKDRDDQPLGRGYGQADGSYSANIPLPRESVIFVADGYKEKVVELIPNTERPVEWDVKLEPYPGVDINAVNFPDDIFREYVRRWDHDQNSVLSNKELFSLNGIDIGEGIKSIKGVEHFYNLQVINVLADASLDALNVNGLEQLKFIYNRSAKLKGISAENLPRLLEVKSFGEEHADLKALSVSNCPKLYFVHCNNSELSSFTAYGCDRLIWVTLTNGKLTSLNVNHMKGLEELDVSHNQLTSLTFSGAPNIIYVNCAYNQLDTLDVRPCKRLNRINVKENRFTYLDLRPASYAVLFASGFDPEDFAHYCGMAGNTGKKMEILTYSWSYDYEVHRTLLFEVTRYLDGNVEYDWTFHDPVPGVPALEER